MPINPNIALGVQPLQLADPMAQYGKVMAIQGAQQQNRLADMQMAEYERARTEEQGLRNYLAKADFTKPETRTGLYQFGKTGRDYVKTLAEQEAAAATLAETKSKTNERDYKLRVEKANKAISDIAALNTPEEAIASIDAHLKNGDIDENKANMLKGRLAAAPSFGAWQKDMLVNILDAKEKLTMTMPKVARQDVGGQIITIQDNPMLPGYGLPVQSMAPIKKTATIGERTAQGQLSLAQQRFMWEKANPGFELKEGEDGTFYGVNKRTLQATPVMVGAAPVAAGTAPVAATPLKGKGKETALTESQGNAVAFGMRMKEANDILEPLEKAGKTNTGLISGAVGGTVGLIPFVGEKLEGVSGSIFNALPQVLGGLSPEQQQVAQARINFITALLRKESGAAIGASEFATAEKNYFPKPGDDAATIAQKQAARKTAIRAMETQAGPGARQMGGSAPSAGAIPGASANNPLGLPGL